MEYLIKVVLECHIICSLKRSPLAWTARTTESDILSKYSTEVRREHKPKLNDTIADVGQKSAYPKKTETFTFQCEISISHFNEHIPKNKRLTRQNCV